MIENERKLYEQRIEVFLRRLKSLFYEQPTPLTIEYSKFTENMPFEQRLEARYQPVQKGAAWGRNWERAWFHLQGTVPREFSGKCVVALINPGGEGLLFDATGTPLAGISVHTLWPMHEFFRNRVEITENARGGEKVDLWLEATAGELFGLRLENDKGDLRPEYYGNHVATIGDMQLAIFRKDIWHLWLDFMVLDDQMRALPEKNVRRARILRALNRAIDLFTGHPETVLHARELLQPELAKPAAASDLSTTVVGHAHLDTAWLWPLHETPRKCARTFSSQIQLIEKYPEYIFGASQAQHYAFVKARYPLLYEKIKKYVAAGRWEVQGGMWVEADCNIISGESMVRQLLHGKNFFREEFGVEVKNLWLPDVFGYSAALPQILKKSRINFFLTQKLSWNQFNRFPHHTFIWRGIDGSEIVTHFPPEDNYNADLRPSRLKHAQENFDENPYLDEFMTLFGVGDGGCGPTEEMVETGRRVRNLEACPKVNFGAAQPLLDRLVARAAELPRWVGELYFELHRGTLTSQAYNKKMNRYLELKLREVEILYSALPLAQYPAAALDRMWKTVLLNQFHDIIPGSSISPVYAQCREDYDALKREVAALMAAAGNRLFQPDAHAVCYFNSLSCAYRRPVTLPDEWAGFEILDESGAGVPVQAENGTAVVQIEIPAFGAATLKRGKRMQPAPSDLPGGWVLENECIRYEFSDQGTLRRAFDKEIQREVLVPGQAGNVFSLYEDRPANWDAWDIDIYYENQWRENAKLEAAAWIATGPVRQGLQFDFSIGASKITQQVFLAQGSRRLDFETRVDWHELHQMLRVAFPVNVVAETASYEIQYGHVKRNTHRNTSWDMAKFEVVAHRFADLSEREFGVALLNDSKYGHKILDNVIDLNLLRAPTMPDPHADQGSHQFIYSLLPHRNDLVRAEVIDEAAQLNQPPACFPGLAGGMLPLFRLDSDAVILEVVKKAEREDAWILRLYEAKGSHASVKVEINRPFTEIHETDLLEANVQPIPPAGPVLALDFKPFEIRTFKIK